MTDEDIEVCCENARPVTTFEQARVIPKEAGMRHHVNSQRQLAIVLEVIFCYRYTYIKYCIRVRFFSEGRGSPPKTIYNSLGTYLFIEAARLCSKVVDTPLTVAQ